MSTVLPWVNRWDQKDCKGDYVLELAYNGQQFVRRYHPSLTIKTFSASEREEDWIEKEKRE